MSSVVLVCETWIRAWLFALSFEYESIYGPTYPRLISCNLREHDCALGLDPELPRSVVPPDLAACDAAARELASKSGFTLEAIMRKHMIVKQRSRDSAIHAITNSEWEVLRPQLAAKAKLKRQGQGQGRNDKNNNDQKEKEKKKKGKRA